MFAKDRFKFTSPNAIDAGEMPPSAPTRPTRSQSGITTISHPEDEITVTSAPMTPEHRIINTSMSFVDARDSATSFLKDVEVSPTRGTDDLFRDEEHHLLDEDYEDEGDQKLMIVRKIGASNNCWSISSTSTYHTERDSLSQPTLDGSRPTKNGGLGWHRPSRRGCKLTLPLRGRSLPQVAMPPKSETQSTYSKTIAFFFCLAPILLVILVSVSISHVMKKKSGEPSHQTYVSGRLFQAIDTLVSYGISDQIALSVRGTPQYLAARWMADIDPLQYEVPSKDVALADSYPFIQRYVLALLYYSTGGNETWHNSLDFLSEHHECSWYHSRKFTDGDVYAMGVTCGSDMHVSDMLIPANNLQGSLPAELAHLSHLQFLSLSHNEITGIIPDLRELTNLQYIDLGTNKLTGSIPAWIEAWSQLKVLGLESNRLTGSLPQALETLTGLITLDLKKNLFKGDIDVVNRLLNLKYLYLGQNGFAGFVDPEQFLMDIQAVREIDISSNLFYGEGFPHSLIRKPNLQVLDISANELRGSIAATIDANFALEVLEINNNGFTGMIPSSIENIVNLRHLDMQMNHFTGTIPDRFVNLRYLTYLSLGENDFTAGPIPAFLSSFTQLQELSLARCNLVGQIPSWLDVMENLKFLNLQANRLEGTIPQAVWDLPELSVLLVTENRLNGTVPQQVANIEDFTILSLRGNNFSGNVDSFCSTATSMESLSFDCGVVTCQSACCNTCCDNPQDSSSCFSKQLMTALGKEKNAWEFKYQSNAYSFSPTIVAPMEMRQASEPIGTSP